MKLEFKTIFLSISLGMVVMAYDPITQKPKTQETLEAMSTPTISPEIINELKDFEHLISTATVDEIVAEHYLVDGNFRTALKYLRSQEFKQLQRQLLTIPEIIDILEFLHLTTTNATTSHMGATTTAAINAVKATFNDYNDDDADADADAYDNNRIGKITTNTGTIISNRNAVAAASIEEALNNKGVHKRPHFKMAENGNTNYDGVVVDDDATALASRFNELQLLVRIVLMEDSEVKAKAYDVHHNKGHTDNKHHHYHHQRRRQCNHRHHYHHCSLGTFTTFVEEILQHLPHSAYQNMINDKCQKNDKFAQFYKALRSPAFKPLIDEAMKTSNIQKIIQTLNSHDVDVKSLEPVAFQVISWGPAI